MIERISILLHFPGDANPIDVSSLYRDGTSHFAERLFNEDKHSVQDTFSCALKHDQGIVNKFRSARGKIRIVVLDASDGSGLFSGVIEPSAAQASHQVNEDLVLEAVDATWRLDDPVAEAFQFPAAIDAAPLKVCDYSDVAHSIFHQVCLLAGYTLGEIVAGAENHATVLHCAARAGEETYREFLDGLLSEHSLVLDDDGLGRLTTRRWTRADPGYDMILDGDDLSVVEPVVWARRYIPEDGVRLEWSEAKVIDDALLFRDSLPVSAQGEFTGQPIAPGDYYPADSDIEDVYQDYVERWLDRPYLERATRLKNKDLSLITTDQAQVVFQAETGIVKESEAFEWGRAKVRFQNVSASIKKMLSFEVRGRALIRSSIKSITAPENAKNPRTVTSRFLFNEASAIAYANAQALDIEYADFEYTFGLNRYLESGTVVRLINQKNNIDTRAIIQDCEFDIGRPVYRYKAIGLAEESSVASTSSVSSGTAAWPYLNSIDAKMASYTQNVPPTNNVTNLAFVSEQNPSGMIDVTVSWDYTQGASPADGFLVFYKRDVTTPGAIDIFRDPSVFVQAGGATSYQTILTLPARQAGAGTLPIHYRFGVVAFGTRRSGTVVHLAGVVEDPAWIDKTFASKIQVDGNNFWDQDSGEMRVGSASSFLHVKPADGTMELGGLDLEITERDVRSYTGQGVQRRAVEVGDEALSWFDSPDTTPASPEQLRARIGRLKVGGDVLLDGPFSAPVSMPWSAPVNQFGSTNTGPVYIQLQSGELRCSYVSGFSLVERIFDFSTNTWQAPVTIDPSDLYGPPCYYQRPSGELRIAYTKHTPYRLVERIWNGSTWGSENTITSDRDQAPAYIELPSGEFRIAYKRYTDNYIVEREWNGTGWGAASVISSAPADTVHYARRISGEVRRIIRYQSGSVLRERIWAGGSWSGETVVSSTGWMPKYVENNLTGELRVIYVDGFISGPIVERRWNGSAWGSPVTIEGASCGWPDAISVNNGEIRVGYVAGGLFYERTLQRYARLGAGIIESGQDNVHRFGNGLMVHIPLDEANVARRNIGRFYYGDVQSNRYIHFKTQAFAPVVGVIAMWRLCIHGYVYGSNANVEAYHVGYVYGRNFTSSASSGTHTITAYLSADMYLCFSIYVPGSLYFTGLLLDVEGVQQGIGVAWITATAITTSPTGAW